MSINAVFPYNPDIYLDPNDRTKVIAVIDRPKIPVRLFFKHKFFPNTAPVQCLLDSGADRNLFPAHWGESLDIKVKNTKPHITHGIGNQPPITVYPHKGIKFYIGNELGTKIIFISEIDFCYEHQVPILGREGFFKYFKKISFIKNAQIKLEF